MNLVKTLSTLAVVAACAGCASQMLSDDRLRSHTAPLVGVSAGELTILNRSEQGTNTYYTVRTTVGAEYQCSINGGGVLAAGMVQGGQCTKIEVAKPASLPRTLEPAKKPVKK